MDFGSIPFLARAIPAGGGGGGGLTIVQQPSKVEEGFNTSVERSLSAVGTGNHLVVVVCGWTSAGAPTISDSAGGSWTGTQVHSYPETTNDTTVYFFIRAGVTGNPTWVRATYGASCECRIGVVEVSGGTPSLDGSPGGAAQSSASQWDHAFTSSVDDVLFIGMASFTNGQTATGISPVTTDGTAQWFAYSRGLFPTAGSNTASFTLDVARGGHKAWIVVKGS